MSPEHLPMSVGKWSCGRVLNDHSNLQREQEERSAATFISCLICTGAGNGTIFV
jgi:hypothetical protein